MKIIRRGIRQVLHSLLHPPFLILQSEIHDVCFSCRKAPYGFSPAYLQAEPEDHPAFADLRVSAQYGKAIGEDPFDQHFRMRQRLVIQLLRIDQFDFFQVCIPFMIRITAWKRQLLFCPICDFACRRTCSALARSSFFRLSWRCFACGRFPSALFSCQG